MLFLPGFKFIFFHVRLTVSCETESTISNSTIFSASIRNVHAVWPSGGGLQQRAMKWASSSPVIFRPWVLVTGFRESAASKPSSTKRFLMRPTFFVDTS